MAQTQTNQHLSTAIEGRIDKSVTGALEISRRGPQTPIFSNMGEILEFSKIMAVSGIAIRKHLRNNPGACAAICMQAQRWQMDPYMVANKSFEVNDQIAFEAQLIASVVNTRAPIKGRLKTRFTGEGAHRRCIASATFIGEDEPTEVISPPFATIQPKNSPLWKNDPDQQLAYYTQRIWARRCCPEILLGVFDVDEIGPGTQVAGTGMRDVTPPRPRLQDFQPQENVAEIEPEPEDEPFSLITGDGEELTFADPAHAANVFADHIAAAGSADMLTGLWDSNGALLAALRDNGLDAYADRLNKRYTDCLDALRKLQAKPTDWADIGTGWDTLLRAQKTAEKLDAAWARIAERFARCQVEAPEIAAAIQKVFDEQRKALAPAEQKEGLL